MPVGRTAPHHAGRSREQCVDHRLDARDEQVARKHVEDEAGRDRLRARDGPERLFLEACEGFCGHPAQQVPQRLGGGARVHADGLGRLGDDRGGIITGQPGQIQQGSCGRRDGGGGL